VEVAFLVKSFKRPVVTVHTTSFECQSHDTQSQWGFF